MARAASAAVPVMNDGVAASADQATQANSGSARKGAGKSATSGTTASSANPGSAGASSTPGAASSAARSAASTPASSTPAASRNLGGPWGASFLGLEPGRTDGKQVHGLSWPRKHTRAGIHPYDEIEWELRTAAISSETGKTVFEQKDGEVPKSWSQLATNVVVSKYF